MVVGLAPEFLGERPPARALTLIVLFRDARVFERHRLGAYRFVALGDLGFVDDRKSARRCAWTWRRSSTSAALTLRMRIAPALGDIAGDEFRAGIAGRVVPQLVNLGAKAIHRGVARGAQRFQDFVADPGTASERGDLELQPRDLAVFPHGLRHVRSQVHGHAIVSRSLRHQVRHRFVLDSVRRPMRIDFHFTLSAVAVFATRQNPS